MLSRVKTVQWQITQVERHTTTDCRRRKRSSWRQNRGPDADSVPSHEYRSNVRACSGRIRWMVGYTYTVAQPTHDHTPLVQSVCCGFAVQCVVHQIFCCTLHKSTTSCTTNQMPTTIHIWPCQVTVDLVRKTVVQVADQIEPLEFWQQHHTHECTCTTHVAIKQSATSSMTATLIIHDPRLHSHNAELFPLTKYLSFVSFDISYSDYALANGCLWKAAKTTEGDWWIHLFLVSFSLFFFCLWLSAVD